MPTVIATSTESNASWAPNQRKVDRCQNGVLWSFYRAGQAGTALWAGYSTDDGATWTAGLQFGLHNGSTTVSYVGSASVFIDVDDYCHVVYRNTQDGKIYYRRGTPNAGRTAWTWSTAFDAGSGAANLDLPDLIAHREGTGWTVHIVTSFHGSTSSDSVYYHRLSVDSGGTVTNAGGGNVKIGAAAYGNLVPKYPSIDFNHNGDGKTVAGGTPHLYAAWSAGSSGSGKGVRFKKASYSAGSWTWGTEREIDSTRHAPDANYWLNCLFDGTRVIIPANVYPGTNVDVMLYERDAGDTTTTTRTLAANAASGAYTMNGSATYDGGGNVYFFGRSTAASPFSLSYRKWVRSTATFEAAVTLDADTSPNPYASAKRGYSNGRAEWIYTDGTASPYSITYDALVLNTAPNAPTLDDPPTGSKRNLSGTPTFDWTFSDPDAGDSQSGWLFRRKISGAGAYEYWNAGTSAWQSTEVVNAGTTSAHTFPSGAWSNGGTIYNWSVATEDAQGARGPYAPDSTVTGHSPATVTVTAPSGTVTDTSRPTTTWSRSQAEGEPQTHYTVKIFDAATYGAGGFDPATSTPVVTSGRVASESARAWTPTIDLTNGTSYRSYVQLEQPGGILSTWAFSGYTLSLTAPAAPTITATAEPSNGRVRLDISGNHDPVAFPDVTYRVQRSEDAGATWEKVRGAQTVTPDGTLDATVYDREATPGVAVQWRAFADAVV